MFVNEDKIIIDTIEVAGFTTAITGMRNPLDSWDRCDSYVDYPTSNGEGFVLGSNDLALAQKLIKGGSEHCKFLRQIYVGANFTLPRYVWSEFDTYGFNVKNSCSTMHTLLSKKKPLTMDMFVYFDSCGYLIKDSVSTINLLAQCYRGERITKASKTDLKRMAKQVLPEGFLQKRTVSTNYAELRNMYKQRKNHQLVEWNKYFVDWVKTLPYAEELIIYEN